MLSVFFFCKNRLIARQTISVIFVRLISIALSPDKEIFYDAKLGLRTLLHGLFGDPDILLGFFIIFWIESHCFFQSTQGFLVVLFT